MAYGKRGSWPVVMELDSASIWWLYTAVGNPLDKAARVVTFTNDTDVDIYFSTGPSDKVGNHTDMVLLPANSFSTWDITTQRALDDKPLLIPVGTQFYARSEPFATPSQGLWVAVQVLDVESGS